MVLGETPSLMRMYYTFPGAERLQWSSFCVERMSLEAREALYSFALRQGLGVSITCRYTVGSRKQSRMYNESIGIKE